MNFYFYCIVFLIVLYFHYSSECSIPQNFNYSIFMSNFFSFMVSIMRGIPSLFCWTRCYHFNWFIRLSTIWRAGRIRGTGAGTWEWPWTRVAFFIFIWIIFSGIFFIFLRRLLSIFMFSRSRTIMTSFRWLISLSRLSKITFNRIFSKIDDWCLIFYMNISLWLIMVDWPL